MCVGTLDKVDQRIRIWKNSRGLTFYDCVCNRRKPIQDFKKIIGHCKMHGDVMDPQASEVDAVEEAGEELLFECEICGRKFERPMQRNGHMRMHKNL